MGSSVKRLAIMAVGIYVGGVAGAKALSAGFSTFMANVVTAVVSMAVSATLSKALGVDETANLSNQLKDRTRMVKEPIITRDTVYGETKIWWYLVYGIY